MLEMGVKKAKMPQKYFNCSFLIVHYCENLSVSIKY